MDKIEYRIKPVTRYIVTRYESHSQAMDLSDWSASTQHGEFDNHGVAHEVAYALCKAEHDRLGYPVGDERIRYPERVGVG